MKKSLKSLGWILFFLTTYIIFQLVSSVLVSIVSEIGLFSWLAESRVPTTLILAGLSALVVYYFTTTLRKRNFQEECRIKPISWKHGIASGILGLSGLAFSSLLLAIVSLLFDTSYTEHMENMEQILSGNKFLIFISIGVMAPILEEILFRGLIFKELERRLNIKAVVIIQALLFGLYHFNLTQGIYTVFLGIILGLALIWTGSIWGPIIVHMVNNSLSFVFSLIGLENNLLLLAVMLLVILGITMLPALLIYLYKTRVGSDLVNQ